MRGGHSVASLPGAWRLALLLIQLGRLRKKSFLRPQFPSAAEAADVLLHLRRGWKPRPFKASIESDFFRNLLKQALKSDFVQPHVIANLSACRSSHK
jgi:hypothetical protein